MEMLYILINVIAFIVIMISREHFHAITKVIGKDIKEMFFECGAIVMREINSNDCLDRKVVAILVVVPSAIFLCTAVSVYLFFFRICSFIKSLTQLHPNPLFNAIYTNQDISEFLTKDNLEYVSLDKKNPLIVAVENNLSGDQFQLLVDATQRICPHVFTATGVQNKSALCIAQKKEHIIPLLKVLPDGFYVRRSIKEIVYDTDIIDLIAKKDLKFNMDGALITKSNFVIDTQNEINKLKQEIKYKDLIIYELKHCSNK